MKINKTTVSLITLLVTAILYAILISHFSSQLEMEDHPSSMSVRLYAASRILLGIVFFISIVFLLKNSIGKKLLFASLITGLIVRIILILFSEPILENDYNRYLWDGAVTAKGINPFLYSPDETLINQIENENDRSTLLELKLEAGVVFNGINHPHLRTIYPTMSQITFAAAYLISSFDITSWRFVLLIFDVVTLILLFIISRLLKRNPELVLIYWLNPIIIHEFYNASHMDLLVLPALMFAVYLFIKNRKYLSTSFLAVAAGFKIFPVALVLLFFRNFLPKYSKLILHGLLFAVLLLIIFYPVYTSPLNESLGLVKYASSWTNNEALYRIINEFFIFIQSYIWSGLNCPLCVTRWLSVVLFGIIVLLISRAPIKEGNDLLKRITIVLAFMFFLSPTQFPWYFGWVVPFLVFEKKYSLIAYPILLPLFQLKYGLQFLVYVQHIPIFIWFCGELYKDDRLREILKFK